MRTDLRVVTPFRPFLPESHEHRALGPFDWIGAIEMLRASVARACECDTVAITDVDTGLPAPSFQYRTRERRLMLWILEVSLCYLAGPQFDRDTVFCSPDQLVFGDLRPWFAGDFGIVVRAHPVRPILNALQWWPLQARDRLVALYERALDLARQLPDELLRWGADSEPFRILLKPARPGYGPRKRAGLVANLIDSRDVLQPLTSEMIAALECGEPVSPRGAVVDFRFTRKRHMRAYFEATIGATV